MSVFLAGAVAVCAILGALMFYMIVSALLRRGARPARTVGADGAERETGPAAIEAEAEGGTDGDAVPSKEYGYRDLVRDLDADVPIEEILKKCGGKFPEPPVEEISAEAQKPPPDRAAERQAWFNGMLAHSRQLKVVPPPPPGRPVVSIDGWVIQCACATDRMRGIPRNCRACGGRGFMILTGKR